MVFLEGHGLLFPTEGGHDDPATHIPAPPLPVTDPGMFPLSHPMECWGGRAGNCAGKLILEGPSGRCWILWEWIQAGFNRELIQVLRRGRSPGNVEVIPGKGFVFHQAWAFPRLNPVVRMMGISSELIRADFHGHQPDGISQWK